MPALPGQDPAEQASPVTVAGSPEGALAAETHAEGRQLASSEQVAGVGAAALAAGWGANQQQPDVLQANAGAATAAVATLSAASIARLRVRMLPYLASRSHPGYNLSRSHFRTQKNKAGTARVVAARQLGVPGAYTLEASLAGCSVTQQHFTVRDYLDLVNA